VSGDGGNAGRGRGGGFRRRRRRRRSWCWIVEGVDVGMGGGGWIEAGKKDEWLIVHGVGGWIMVHFFLFFFGLPGGV
jgi:hypothetical protein